MVTAAGSDKLFTVDAGTGAVGDRISVGATPRGIALVSGGTGAPEAAWVLNAVGNTVSLVDLAAAEPSVTATVTLEDPTHPDVKRGRIAFNNANASSTPSHARVAIPTLIPTSCSGCWTRPPATWKAAPRYRRA